MVGFTPTQRALSSVSWRMVQFPSVRSVSSLNKYFSAGKCPFFFSLSSTTLLSKWIKKELKKHSSLPRAWRELRSGSVTASFIIQDPEQPPKVTQPGCAEVGPGTRVSAPGEAAVLRLLMPTRCTPRAVYVDIWVAFYLHACRGPVSRFSPFIAPLNNSCSPPTALAFGCGRLSPGQDTLWPKSSHTFISIAKLCECACACESANVCECVWCEMGSQ